jgi:hypothetical protein
MLDILDRAGMAECKPCSTPVDTNPKVAAANGALVSDASDFRSLAGTLRYLTFTGQTLPTLYSRSAFICMTPKSLTSRLSSGFFAMSVALSTSVSCCDRLQLILLSTLILIGLVAGTHASPPRAMLCSLATTSSLGPPSVRTRCQDPALKLSIAQWPMAWPRPPSSVSFYRSCTPLYGAPQWCSSVTTLVPSTCPPTQFSISALNTSRSIFTSSGSELQLVIFVSYMFQPLHNMRTSSLRDFPLRYSWSSGPVYTCRVTNDSTAGPC